MPGSHNYSGSNFPKSLWMSPMMSYKGYVHFPQSLMQWSSFCKPHVTSLHPIKLLILQKLSRALIQTNVSLSSSLHKKSYNHIWWIFLTEQKSVKIFLLRIYDDGFLVSLFLGSTSCHSDLLQNKSYFPVSPMDFCLEEFLPRRLLPQKDPLAKNECPRNVSPYLAKSTCGLARVLIYQTLTTWAIYLQKMWWYRQETAIPQRFFAPNQLVNVLVLSQTVPITQDKTYY